MEQISEHVYLHRDSRQTNLGLIRTPQGPVLVDSPMLLDDARAWRDAVKQVTNERPRYLINTDHHIGHALGDWAFPDTPVITHRHAAYMMLEKWDATWRGRLVESFRSTQPDMAAELEVLPLPRPELGVVDEMTLHLDDFAIELMHGGGHTPGTLLVSVLADSVLFAGDLVVEGMHPNMGDANTRQWLDALQKIRVLNPRILVPGHGELASEATLEYVEGYVKTLSETVGEYYRAGLSRKDVVAKVRSVEGYPLGHEERSRAEQRLKSSVQRVYDEYKERDKEFEKARAS